MNPWRQPPLGRYRVAEIKRLVVHAHPGSSEVLRAITGALAGSSDTSEKGSEVAGVVALRTRPSTVSADGPSVASTISCASCCRTSQRPAAKAAARAVIDFYRAAHQTRKYGRRLLLSPARSACLRDGRALLLVPRCDSAAARGWARRAAIADRPVQQSAALAHRLPDREHQPPWCSLGRSSGSRRTRTQNPSPTS